MSLQRRISAAVALGVTLVVAVLSVVEYYSVRSHLRGEIDSQLTSGSQTFLRPHPPGGREGMPGHGPGFEPNHQPTPDRSILTEHGIDPDRPIVIFVGRITRQKGLPYLLRAAAALDAEAQLVVLASAADTPDIATEVEHGIAKLQDRRHGVFWIRRMVPKPDLIQLFSAATVFVCPSIYEPMGIVNLEAMACETAVVATCTGGIPEVVADGETGVLVPIDPDPADPYGAPRDPAAFAAAFADAINVLVRDPTRAAAMGAAGRRRAVEYFSWTAIAERTRDLYASLL